MSEENIEPKVEAEAKPEVKAEAPTKSAVAKPAVKTESGSIAVIRIRGGTRIDIHIKDTLKALNLKNQHNLVILPNTPNVVGMLKKAKDYITWGTVTEDVLKEIETKRGEKTFEGEAKKIFRLHPPIGGFERKGIKAPFSTGGVLGDRGNAISILIRKML